MTLDSSSLLFSRGNEATIINNSDGADFHITQHGSDWLWAAFSVFGLYTLSIVGFSFFKKPKERLFLYLSAAGMVSICVSYFSQASNLGWAPVHAEFNHVTTSTQKLVPGMRQIFYARWVGYFVAFPPTLLTYATLVGLSWSNALFALFAQNFTVVCLLVGTLIHSTYKWGYYSFGAFGWLLITYSLLVTFRSAAKNTDAKLSMHSLVVSSCAVILLMLYPIAWALSEGGNVIQPDSEAVFYGVLDICFFVILGGYVLVLSNNVDYEQRGLVSFDSPVFTRPQYLRNAAAETHPYVHEKVDPEDIDHLDASQDNRHSAETAAAHV